MSGANGSGTVASIPRVFLNGVIFTLASLTTIWVVKKIAGSDNDDGKQLPDAEEELEIDV